MKPKKESKENKKHSVDTILNIENKDNSKKSKFSSLRITIIFSILIAIICIALSPVTFQNDTFYTIEIGRNISENGIDMQDPFSWHEDLAYTYPHWLYDYITYIIYNLFGFIGIYISTCILSAILGISTYLVSSKLTKNNIITFFVTVGAMYVLKDQIAARAQLVTFILFIWTIFFIERFIKTKKIGYAIPLIIIPIAIANIHVAVFPFYFILFLPYIAEYMIAQTGDLIVYKKFKILKLKFRIKYLNNKLFEEFEIDPSKKISVKNSKTDINEKVEKLKEELDEIKQKVVKIKIKRTKNLKNPYKLKIRNNKNVKWLILVMIIALFTGFLTPLGTTPYTYLFDTMRGNTTGNINEHLPIELSESTEALIVLIIFLAILSFTKTKIRLSDLFMFGGLTYLMLDSRRQISMFALFGAVIISRMIVDLIHEYDKIVFEDIEKQMKSKLTIVFLIVSTIVFSIYLAKDKFDDNIVNENDYPVAASEYILKNLNLDEIRLYNDYNYGSYLLFKGIPVFIDSRADLYAPEFSGKEEDIFMDYIETSGLAKYYEDTFEKYGITHVILFQDSKMNMIIKETEKKAKVQEYYELYSDDRFVIYQIIE